MRINSMKTTRKKYGLNATLFSSLALAALIFSSSAFSQETTRNRQMNVMPDRVMDNGAELKVSLVLDKVHFDEEDHPPQVKVGAKPDICFSSKEEGFVSIWSHDALGRSSIRILPNEYIKVESDEKGYRVEAGSDYCYSKLPGKSYLQVGEPLGEAQIYFHFTADLDLQFSPEDMPTIGNKSTEEPAVEYDHDYASKVISYEVLK